MVCTLCTGCKVKKISPRVVDDTRGEILIYDYYLFAIDYLTIKKFVI